jgi:hypothetical protein
VNTGMKTETLVRRHDAQMHSDNAYSRAMDEALEADPPVIEWVKGPGGILTAASVHDPHVVTPNKPKRTR